MAGNADKILIVEDEPQIRTLLRGALQRAGYRVVEASTAREALNAQAIDHPDLVLLDLGLPDRDGLDLVAALRPDASVRLIVISAREQTDQKVAALDLGADDYVTKPFDIDEVMARIRAALRQRANAEAERPLVEVGDISIDLVKRIVLRRGKEVHLTPKEYGVLAELAKWPGRVLTHSSLLRAVWGIAHEQHQEYLRVVMRSLRQKLEDVPAQPRLLINEPAVGYRLIGPRAEP